MPFLIERFVNQRRAPDMDPRIPRSFAEADPLAEVKRFYYDTAQATHAAPMSALRQVVPLSQILFGSDYPYRTAGEQIEGLTKSGMFDPGEVLSVTHENVVPLIPRRRILA